MSGVTSELRRSDGTEAGTVVKDIWPGPEWPLRSGLTGVDGTVNFGANDGVHGFELWAVSCGRRESDPNRRGPEGAPGHGRASPLNARLRPFVHPQRRSASRSLMRAGSVPRSRPGDS